MNRARPLPSIALAVPEAGCATAAVLPPVADAAAVPEAVTLRAGRTADAAQIHALVGEYPAQGHLRPRRFEDVAAHAHRFVTACARTTIVGCGELVPVSRTVAEIRSLVADFGAGSRGVERAIVSELGRRARAAGFHSLCALTDDPAFFLRLDFSIVPQSWIPETVTVDSVTAQEIGGCPQYAVILPLTRSFTSCVPLASLHG